MKLIYFSNEFPHDDLQDLFRRLYTHSKDRAHPVLARFLDEATLTIRDEVRRLPAALQGLIPPFETILDFADHPELRKGPLSGSVEGVLLCVVELATLIGYVIPTLLRSAFCVLINTLSYYENRPNDYEFDPLNTCLAGLGIGLLASSVVSLSPCLADLPIAGAEVVRIAFRLGVLVDEVSANLQPRDLTGSPESWAYVIPGVTAVEVQKELDEINTREVSRIQGNLCSNTSP